MMKKTILYVDFWECCRIQAMKLAGIRRYAEMRGWTVEVCCEADSRPKRLRKLLAQIKPLGVIVECSAAHADLPPRFFGSTPVVYLDCSPSLYGGRMTKVLHNGKATARLAFRELFGNHPSSFAVVGYREKSSWSITREREFCERVKESGKTCAHFRYRKETPESRSARLTAWVAALPRHCAVFAVNDDVGEEVESACGRCGKRIPWDMTLVGVDNFRELTNAGDPRLSSIQVDFECAGYKAAKALDCRLHGFPAETCDDWFDPLMVVRRESTRGCGRREALISQVVETIRREACNGLTVRDVTARTGIGGSRRWLEIRFRESMGHSILEEIQRVRMEKVQFLLSSTDTPLGAIAPMCGFRSEIALHKFFRSETGMCMREWRKRNRKR